MEFETKIDLLTYCQNTIINTVSFPLFKINKANKKHSKQTQSNNINKTATHHATRFDELNFGLPFAVAYGLGVFASCRYHFDFGTT